jgi:Fur family ferric uptake transcriptional regulator
MDREAASPRLPVREWDEQLRARGYRVTPQRQLVLEAVARLDHATPEEIGAQVQQTARGVNISTIYRTLELLQQLGRSPTPTRTGRPPTTWPATPTTSTWSA